MCLVREITKIHEEYIYGTTSELINLDETTLKGEMVLVIEGNKNKKEYSDEELLSLINENITTGLSKKEACKKVEELTNIKKNYLYQLTLK